MTALATPVRVFGASWCEASGRARRVLASMHVAHAYEDVDADLDALRTALELRPGPCRTPVVSIGNVVLAAPSTAVLLSALIESGVLRPSDVRAHLLDRNAGDLDRALRLTGGLGLAAATARLSAFWRLPLQALAGGLVLSGARGWCPIYHRLAVSSRGGPGDHPDDAERAAWLTPTARLLGDQP